MRSTPFVWRLLVIQLIVWIQRALRQLLRASWTAAAVFLLFWGIHSLFGWPADPRIWLLVAVLVSLFSLWGIFFPWPNFALLSWSLDRKLELQEQVSTSWQVICESNQNQVAHHLVTETSLHLQKYIPRIAFKGWFIARDLLSCLIVAILFWLVFGGNMSVTSFSLPQTESMELPPLGEDPSAEQIIPFGIPGMVSLSERIQSSASSENELSREGQSTDAGDNENISSLNMAILETLKALGVSLSKMAVGYDTGQALQRGELIKAAEEFEIIADQIDRLSEETKNQLAEALAEASNRLDQLKNQEENKGQSLSESMESTTSALQENNDSTAKKNLDKVASDLRELAQQIPSMNIPLYDDLNGYVSPSSGSGGAGASPFSSNRERGAAEDFTRLQNEGETLTLTDANDQQGFLSPGSPTADAQAGSASGEFSVINSADEFEGSSVLTPFYYSWMWRDVVSAYFSPR
jgi:hypothetical protein